MSAADLRGSAADSGRLLSGDDHLRQSIANILSTPIGSRIERRDYGSLVPQLIDRPINPVTLLQIASAALVAIIRWEPRIRPSRLSITPGDTPGTLVAELAGLRVDGPADAPPVALSIAVMGAR